MGWLEDNGFDREEGVTPLPRSVSPPSAGAPDANTSRANFDAQAYLQANPDVARAIQQGQFGGDPYRHWQEYGQREGRAFTPVAASSTPPTTNGGSSDASQATAFGKYTSAGADPQVKQAVADFIKQNGLTASQQDPSSLKKIAAFVQSKFPNMKVQVAKTDANGHTGGLVIDGNEYQLIDGSNRWTDLQPWEQGGSSSAGGVGQSFGALLNGGGDPFAYANGSLLTPFTEEYKNPYGDAPQFKPYQDFLAPAATALTPYQAPAPYVAPTGEEVKNDPGYAFGLKEGEGALQNSAIARRFANTGSTLKDILKYGTDYATTKYNDAVARGESIYGLNAQTGLNANQAANSAVQTNNNNTLDRATKTYEYGYNQNLQSNSAARSAYDTNVGNSFAQFLQKYNQFRQNKQDQYNMLSGAASLG